MENQVAVRSVVCRVFQIGSPSRFLAGLHARCPDPTIFKLLKEFLDQNTDGISNGLKKNWEQSESGIRVLELDHSVRVQLLFAACVEIFDDVAREGLGDRQSYFALIDRIFAARGLIRALLRQGLRFAKGDVALLISLVSDCHAFNAFPIAILLNVIATHKVRGTVIPSTITDALRDFREQLRQRARQFRKLPLLKYAEKIDTILDESDPHLHLLGIQPGEAWSDAAIAQLSVLNDEQRARWIELLLHARSANGTRPTRKWLKIATERVTAITTPEFCRVISHWFSQVEKTRTQRWPLPQGRYEGDPNLLFQDVHAMILKGLAWSCIGINDALLVRSLGDAGCAAFKKVPMHGPRCLKLGNAVVVALSQMPGNEAAAQLGRISASVKNPSVRKYVAKGLNRIADRTGQTPEDLAELAVPAFGLNSDGKLIRELGAFTAEISVLLGDEVKLQWRRADGKMQKSLPAEVKRDHAIALKELNRTVRDIRKMLPAQRVRIERLLMGRGQWSVADWRSRYVYHPLVGNMSRRLIWEFTTEEKTTTGMLLDGVLVDETDRPVTIRPDTQIRLWHPIQSLPEHVLAWRNWLERHEVTQPFKQAHREIYILTDAEIRTVTYSNRFAAHILRQHQFAALAQARGWTYRLQGNFDSHNTPTLRLPQHDLRVELWVESINENEMTESGIFTHVSTDQLRFYRLNDTEPMNLADVDPLLFSEILRDVDLFVGVTSVGNDPQWQDAGTAPFGGYWHSVSFGDLGESAKTRKAVLERLIPRLKIAGRCTLDDKFLIVRGDLHTYKIHLGSGNILFGGSNQFLCIVPDRSFNARDDLFLPFEGDRTLSIIISKAMLLADDNKIKDPSITRQILR